MRYILSYILYSIGDIISITIMNYGDGYGFKLYNQVMLWSVELDKEGKIWKKVKRKKKNNNMNWIKILNFIDGVFEEEQEKPILGTLYKIKGEDLPFRYIRFTNEIYSNKPIYHFKHHQLKEYKFNNLSKVERKANLEEIRVYNLIKDHVNEIAENND